MPLAFLAGVDGFAAFAPYLLVVLVATRIVRHIRIRG
jgi:hypothetical protein